MKPDSFVYFFALAYFLDFLYLDSTMINCLIHTTTILKYYSSIHI